MTDEAQACKGVRKRGIESSDKSYTEYITYKSGRPYQYFHYSAFGEVLVERDASYGSFQTSYTFNAKEFDVEPKRPKRWARERR